MADRFEREIEDILRRIDKFPRQRPTDRARGAILQRLAAGHRALTSGVLRLSLGQIMLAGMACILIGFFARSVLGDLWQYIVIAGLIAFFAAFFLSFVGNGPTRGARGRYWRGRPVESYYSSGPTLFERLLQWWRRRQSGL